jgi:hypothetical protein
MGQHADARELTALYIQSGVPIYPQCLGYSYNTLIWRMGIEALEMENSRDESATRAQTSEAQGPDPANDGSTTERRPIDLFSAESNERGHSPNLSYLEEKCMFWFNQYSGGTGRRISLMSRANFAPPAAPILAAGGDSRRVARFPGFRPDVSPSRSSTVWWTST